MRQAMAALVKAPESATDEQLEIGARAALPLLDLGRAALTLTGAKSADEAAGVLATWQGAAAALAAREADEAAALKVREKSDDEPMMETETIAQAALAMVTLPPNVNFLEAIVLPVEQVYLGRG
jgi:hypothetical protein